MFRLWKSFALRLALICGLLVMGSITVFSVVFYFGTIRVMKKEVDGKLASISNQLTGKFEAHGLVALHKEIEVTLNDKVDADTEIYFLADPRGSKITGNLAGWKDSSTSLDLPVNREVIRDGRPSSARLVLHKLHDGSLLVVGRDMNDLNQMEVLVWRTIGIGGLAALVLATGAGVLIRYLLERRVGTIRLTIEKIEKGNLGERIHLTGVDDEFDRLSDEMNRMLDRIEQLMDGVRHVSNAIAHNLRTPLGRIRSRLDEALRSGSDATGLVAAANFSIEQVDSLISIFEKLLQIAESESGARRQPFKPVLLNEVVINVVELYDAIAEAHGITLSTDIDGDLKTFGDKDLLSSALANLLDNALKYGARSVKLSVTKINETGSICVSIQDDGPGIPLKDRAKVTEPFYRLDQTVPGTGLGLSIVAAIAHLHGASLRLEDASPGLVARLIFPLSVSV